MKIISYKLLIENIYLMKYWIINLEFKKKLCFKIKFLQNVKKLLEKNALLKENLFNCF